MSQNRFESVSNSESKLLLSRCEDIIKRCEKSYTPCFSFFLNQQEQELISSYNLLSNRECNAFFYGGYQQAQRKVLCATSEYDAEIDYPFSAITISLPKGYSVSHRDILGSLMALKLRREAVGDILVDDCLAVVYLLNSVVDLVLLELDKIGRVGVKCQKGAPDILPNAFNTIDLNTTVSSMRLDCIVAAFVNKSRGDAQRFITQGLVQLNHMVEQETSKIANAGNTVSIRGFGKFEICEVGSKTKKGRLHVIYKKFV